MNLLERFREKHNLKADQPAGVITSPLEEVTVREESSSGRLMITAVATTSAVDLDDEVVVPGGANTAPIERLKAVYYNHDYNSLPVATVVNLKRRSDGWVIQALTARGEFARDVAITVQDGAINAGSIGFVRKDYGAPTVKELDTYGPHSLITRTWDWHEWSITPMPCNQTAMIESWAAKSLPDATIIRIESLASKGRISLKSARAMGVPERKSFPVPRTIRLPRVITLD